MGTNEPNLNNQNYGFSNTSQVQFNYASLLDRIIAELIDGILLGIVSLILLILFTIIAGPFIAGSLLMGDSSTFSGLTTLFSLVILAVNLGYRIVTEGILFSATIGKKIMRLKVVDEAGNNLTLQKAAIRNVIKIFSYAIPFLNFIIVLANLYFIATGPRKQAIHDMLAQTFVVKNQ